MREASHGARPRFVKLVGCATNCRLDSSRSRAVGSDGFDRPSAIRLFERADIDKSLADETFNFVRNRCFLYICQSEDICHSR
jgi:hypothetical protein